MKMTCTVCPVDKDHTALRLTAVRHLLICVPATMMGRAIEEEPQCPLMENLTETQANLRSQLLNSHFLPSSKSGSTFFSKQSCWIGARVLVCVSFITQHKYSTVTEYSTHMLQYSGDVHVVAQCMFCSEAVGLLCGMFLG